MDMVKRLHVELLFRQIVIVKIGNVLPLVIRLWTQKVVQSNFPGIMMVKKLYLK